MRVVVIAETVKHCEEAAATHGYYANRNIRHPDVICVTPFNQVFRGLRLHNAEIIIGELFSPIPEYKLQALIAAGIKSERLDKLRVNRPD